MQVGNPVRLAHEVRAEVDAVSECKGPVIKNVDCEEEKRGFGFGVWGLWFGSDLGWEGRKREVCGGQDGAGGRKEGQEGGAGGARAQFAGGRERGVRNEG